MGRAVGLDIGSRTIKVVELSGSPKSFKVQRVLIRPVPGPPAATEEAEGARDPDEALSAALRDTFDTLKLPKDDVCVAFDSGVTILRDIVVPFLEDDQIRKVVRFEAENHLHSHSIEEVVVNWVKTGESRDGSRLTVFASPKNDLQRLVAVTRAAGIEPASVDLDVTAVYAACDAAGVFREHPNVILLDVGARSCALVLVAEGRPLVVRAFLLGTDLVEAGLSKELRVSSEEGRRRARLPAAPRADDLLVPSSALSSSADEGEKGLEEIEADVAEDLRQQFVRKLHREAMRSLASIRADSNPDRVLLTGGGALLPGLVEALATRFELPVEHLDLGRWVEWRDQGSDPEFTRAAAPAAVGCALRMLGHNPLGIELLREEFAPTNRFDLLKGALATLVTLLFSLLLGLAVAANQRKDAEVRRYSYVAQRAGSLLQAAELRYRTKRLNEPEDVAKEKIRAYFARTPQDHTRIDAYRGLLLSRYRELREPFGYGNTPQIQSALKAWLEIYRALDGLPREAYGGWFRILRLDIRQLTASLRVEVAEQAAIDKIRQQFEQSPYFRERARNSSRVVDIGAATPQRGNWQVDFDFRFREEGE